MTARGRIEPRLPELLSELAPARIPDYFDDLLRAAERTPQRPAWRSPERWFPMGVIARSAPLGLPSWRPLILLALLLLAAAVGLLAIAGSRPPAVPAPLSGPAGNGPIAYSTADGEIVGLDPATGRTTPLVAGAAHDEAPWFTRDGSRFLFARVNDDGTAALMAANADGSGVQELLPAGALGSWVDWSPAGDRVVVSDNTSQLDLVVVDVGTRQATTVTVPVNVRRATWRPGHDQLVLVTNDDRAGRTYWLANPDGTGFTGIPTADGAINEPSLSSDGRYLAYTTWKTGAGSEGVLHVFDLDTGTDRVVIPPDARYTRLSPQFSPDGTRILVERYDTAGYRLAVVDVATGEETVLGDTHPQMAGGAAAEWSPDGTRILATYRDDDSTWLLAADGSTANRFEAPVGEQFSWRRVAP